MNYNPDQLSYYISNNPAFGQSGFAENTYDLNLSQTIEQALSHYNQYSNDSDYNIEAAYDKNSNLTGLKAVSKEKKYRWVGNERVSYNDSYDIEINEDNINNITNAVMKNREGRPGLNIETGEVEEKIDQASIKRYNEKRTNNSEIVDNKTEVQNSYFTSVDEMVNKTTNIMNEKKSGNSEIVDNKTEAQNNYFASVDNMVDKTMNIMKDRQNNNKTTIFDGIQTVENNIIDFAKYTGNTIYEGVVDIGNVIQNEINISEKNVDMANSELNNSTQDSQVAQVDNFNRTSFKNAVSSITGNTAPFQKPAQKMAMGK